jgi:hypothetical protein
MFEYLQLRDFARYRNSAWVLVAANALPLFGVLLLGWDAFSIVALYWTENVVIGAINVLKMVACKPDANEIDWSQFKGAAAMNKAVRVYAHHGIKLFFIPFFIVHYGLFCLVHGVFIFAIFKREAGGFGPFGGFDNFLRVFSSEHLWIAVLGFAVSHLWSFVVNYLGRGEYRKTTVPILMFQPYARVVVLHVAILIGGIVAFALGSNVLVLMLLVAGKTMLDLALHLREHERIADNAMHRDAPILPEIILDQPQKRPSTPPAAEQ